MRMSGAPAGVVLYGGDGDGVTVLVGEVLVAAAPLLLAHVGKGQEGRLVQRQVQQLPIVGALGEEEEVHDHLPTFSTRQKRKVSGEGTTGKENLITWLHRSRGR